MNETVQVEGQMNINGKIAYVEQEPILLSDSIKNNILYGKEYNREKYLECLRCTDLITDISNLLNGDNTIVGDKGVKLSGGQKARVSLARAVYSDKSIYLLDDPLSAVDNAVKDILMNDCICGVLNNKIRILVTHHIEYLSKADKICILNEGKIFEGVYHDSYPCGNGY